MYFLVALTAVSIYEFSRSDLKKISKKARKKYEKWLDD